MAGDDRDSVEWKFLAAIAANPLDREARSVYADWLDEQGDLRGEYLRLEQQLRDIPSRLATLAAGLDHAWILRVTREVDVVLVAAGRQLIMVIKLLREHSAIGLAEAKAKVDFVSETSPQMVKERISAAEADVIVRAFEAQGATVRVVPHVPKYPDLRPVVMATNPPRPDDALYAVVIREILTGQRLAAIKLVRALMGSGLKEAKDLVDLVTAGTPRAVVSGLDRWRAAEINDQLRAACTATIEQLR
jgi:uncharacterized protein (TIGR02996 family)